MMFRLFRRKRLYAQLEACQKAADDARQRNDTRSIHSTLQRLKAARHAVLAMELRR